jgi:large subunit ribosomal protein L16
MLSPKNIKYRKPHRSYLRGLTSSGSLVSFGDYGIQSIQITWLTSRQVEASRRVLTRYVRRNGKLWIRIFPDKIVTRRPAETRIGSGKGSLQYWVAPIRPGKILFELSGISEIVARQATRIAASKLPSKVRFVVKSLL